MREKQKKNPQFKIGSHPAYGNLENIVFVLDKAFAQHEQFETSLEKKTATDFRRYEATCDRRLTEIDRLIATLSNLPKVQREVFETRVLAYVLRDAVHDAADKMETYELRGCVQKVTKLIQTVFERRKRLTDSVFRNRRRLWVATLVARTPYVVVRRLRADRSLQFSSRPPSSRAFLVGTAKSTRSVVRPTSLCHQLLHRLAKNGRGCRLLPALGAGYPGVLRSGLNFRCKSPFLFIQETGHPLPSPFEHQL